MNWIYIIWRLKTLLRGFVEAAKKIFDVEMCWNIKQSSMFEICFTLRKTRRRENGEKKKGNWWWPISISLWLDRQRWHRRIDALNLVLLKRPSSFFTANLNLNFRRFRCNRARTPANFQIKIRWFFHSRANTGNRFWCNVLDRISHEDNLYWRRVYLFSVSYRAPAATTFLSRKCFAISPA